MKPSAILFDLDDTILSWEGGDPRQLWWMSVEAHTDHFGSIGTEALFAEIQSVAAVFWSDAERHRRGRLEIHRTRRELVRRAAENLGCANEAAAHALADYYHERRENDVVLFDGALETLERLRQMPIRTALITNGGTDVQRAKIAKYSLERLFDLVLVEGELGIGKPDPAIYQHALRKLDAPADRTWMVGDNLEWEVRAPQQLGIHSIWHDHLGQGLPPTAGVRPDRIIQRISELLPLLSAAE